MNTTITPSDRKKALIITTFIYTFLLLLLFFIRFWPPSNTTEALLTGGGGGGLTVNFGDSDLGSGKNYTSETLDIQTESKSNKSMADNSPEDILSQNSEDDTYAITKAEKPKKKVIITENPTKNKENKPKVDKNTNDVLSNLLNGNKGGDGNDNQAGNKGKSNGSLNNSGYGSGGSGDGTGNGNGSGNGSGSGSGGGVGYSLGNRKALSKPSPKYICDETGRVVVEVVVDRSGNTISVVTGIKGTTNTAKCLLEQAKIAAMNTKWQASTDAPEKQIGKIIYSFSLN